jgi:ribosomal protein L7Ae-like RNA K-turn-binding protein
LVRTLEECAVACVHVARKAGRAVSGYAQVMRALAHEPVALLLVAADTAPERRRHYSEQCLRRQIPSRPFLSKTRLGALVGREESSAIGILEPRLAERLIFYLEAMSRLTER